MNVIKMLLMGNVDVNEADSEGNTALHWCLSGGSSTQEPRCLSQKLLCLTSELSDSFLRPWSSSVIVQDCVAPAQEWCQGFSGEQIRAHAST